MSLLVFLILPKSESFSDEGFCPPPKKWKGICQTDGNFTCNNKVIGARYYKGLGKDVTFARDTIGHGTHTASTVASRRVKEASFFCIAQGYARGAVPSAMIVMYKVCNVSDYPNSSILAGLMMPLLMVSTYSWSRLGNILRQITRVTPWPLVLFRL
ncbi:LOW QUALITY PROTEIN: subtilisin-like protein protease SBT4.4 [Cinnamomum micranthum f. kanehirae]|uniref:Subtilisin-like protein protease SBT4.4 n=1 Tax=Cinnamomum micranthum f. kanehirae TaxID=337451 RepID=A0A443NC09_9MAGN|nr:LOW QUALITY PROTEIN: subtilisin-like protein protease SBT4.4 [Cinnamomum micranthum f. kanehirae]